MARKFSELRDRMSPEARARSHALAQAMLARTRQSAPKRPRQGALSDVARAEPTSTGSKIAGHGR